jgi:putative transposase
MPKSKLATLLPTAVTTPQRLEALAKHDAGAAVADLCRELQISGATFYKWKKDQASAEDDQQRRLQELESENKRLKRMYSELSMDHDILKQGYGMLKKWQAQDAKRA